MYTYCGFGPFKFRIICNRDIERVPGGVLCNREASFYFLIFRKNSASFAKTNLIFQNYGILHNFTVENFQDTLVYV